VAIWKYCGPVRESNAGAAGKGGGSTVVATAAAHWELQYKTLMRPPIMQLSWYVIAFARCLHVHDATFASPHRLHLAIYCFHHARL